MLVKIIKNILKQISMKINSRNNGLIIGAFFTVGSLILTITFIVPILTIVPGAIVEYILASFIDNEPYSNVGKATLFFWSLIFVISLFVISRIVKRRIISNSYVITIMVFEYFIIHTLGFYIYWASILNFRSDGQLIFTAVASFPYSSIVFLLVGLVIDIIKKNDRTDISTQR